MQAGRQLSGARGTYTIESQLYRTIYSAICTRTQRPVIIKTERVDYQLDNERAILNQFKSSSHIRQLIDEVRDPPALVLNKLDGDILDATKELPVRGNDLRYVARVVLERLRDMHKAGLVHTDVKPRNILVNYWEGHGQEKEDENNHNKAGINATLDQSQRFNEVQLSDFGDAFPTRAVFNFDIQQPAIGAALWRSPEAILGLRWDTSTDIWSYGATLLSLVAGRGSHVFRPEAAPTKTYAAASPIDDIEGYQFQVLVKQLSHFGPWPDRLLELVEDDKRETMLKAWQTVKEKGLEKPFEEMEVEGLTAEEREFLSRLLKLDPRDRAKADELLKHAWFDDGRDAGLKGLHTG